jgi:hypothetical protein
MLRILLISSLASFSVACSSMPAAERSPQWKRWSMARGGVVDAQHSLAIQQRADAALARLNLAPTGLNLAPTGLNLDPTERGIVLRILDSSRVAAYAWRDGSIFLTRGLLQVVNDDELSAAIAHEIGHLRGLGDDLSHVAAEQLADELGCETLVASGIEPLNMLDMLVKLDDHSGNTLRAPIRQRIARLQSSLTEQPSHVSVY